MGRLLVAVALLLVVGCSVGHAQTYAYDLTCGGVNWTTKTVRLDAWFIGRLASGVWGCDWLKIFGPGYWDGGTATGTFLGWSGSYPLKTISGNLTVLASFPNSGSYNVCMVAQGTGTYGVVGKNCTFTVDWASHTFSFQGAAFLPPTIDNNGVVVPGTGGQPQGGGGSSGGLTDGDKTWWQALFTVSPAKVTEMQGKLTALKTAGPWGTWAALKDGLGSDTGQTDPFFTWRTPGVYLGGNWVPGVEQPFVWGHNPGGMTGPGSSAYEPWNQNTDLRSWFGTIRTVLQWLIWGSFVVCLGAWLKGRWRG